MWPARLAGSRLDRLVVGTGSERPPAHTPRSSHETAIASNWVACSLQPPSKLLSIARNSSAVWSHSCALVGSIGRWPARVVGYRSSRPLLRTRDDRPMAGPICRLSVLAAIVEGTRALGHVSQTLQACVQGARLFQPSVSAWVLCSQYQILSNQWESGSVRENVYVEVLGVQGGARGRRRRSVHSFGSGTGVGIACTGQKVNQQDGLQETCACQDEYVFT